MDKSQCKFRFGGKGSTTAFKLDQMGYGSQNHKNVQFMDMMFAISVTEEDLGIETKRRIGLDFSMERTLRPYILKYYVPCITIVIISQISFVIPLDALPGRVALLVTLFLTLTSLFIQQMVSILFAKILNKFLINYILLYLGWKDNYYCSIITYLSRMIRQPDQIWISLGVIYWFPCSL